MILGVYLKVGVEEFYEDSFWNSSFVAAANMSASNEGVTDTKNTFLLGWADWL